MEDFNSECFLDVFTEKNLKSFWETRNSDIDIIAVDSSFPIRNKLNQVGTRNIELIVNTNFGDFTKPIALIENSEILFPEEFIKYSRETKFVNFKSFAFKKEINYLIGAFSIETLHQTIKKQDIDSFYSNGLEFELVVAYDGSLQCFKKTRPPKALEMIDPTSQLLKSDLDNRPLSSFKFSEKGLGIFPTNFTHTLYESCITQRLLPLFNGL